MKKLLVVMLSLAFVMAFAFGTLCAKKPAYTDYRAVFESDIVDGRGIRIDGEVYIRSNGAYKIELKGVEDGTYSVTLRCSNIVDTTLNDLVVEDGEGKSEGYVYVPCVKPYIEIEGPETYYSGFDLT
jgi:hypothetical protein